jgi:glyoxylase-like metal-dependent hydrolase (beta-lactamase superfamily II)
MGKPDVRMFTVGPVQENAYIVRASGTSTSAVMVDPGEEPERLLAAAKELGVQIEGILITHCHFDHIGAVAPIAKATGAPVWCPEFERPLLTDIMRWVPAGFGPFENYEPEHTVKGGERIAVAGMEFEVIFTPGHSPGHVTYVLAPQPPSQTAEEDAGGARNSADMGPPPAPLLLSGDVLFQGSVGRVDLPGGDWNTLERSIGELIRRYPSQTVVYPGHMGVTTLGRELSTNPFLSELRVPAPSASANQPESARQTQAAQAPLPQSGR